MQTRSLVALIAILIIVWVLGALIFSPSSGQSVSSGQRSLNIQSISAIDAFANGVHTLTGSIDLPTPCYILDASTTVATTTPEQVSVAFTVTPPTEGQYCAQVINKHPFMLTATATKNATFTATLNNSPIKFDIQKAVPATTTAATSSGIMIPVATST